MRILTLTLGILLVLLLGTVSGRAADAENDNMLRPGPRDTDQRNGMNEDTREDLPAFQMWYGTQLRGIDGIDEFTGERFADLVQLVVDVAPNSIQVTARDGSRSNIILNRRTEIISIRGRRGMSADMGRNLTPSNNRRPLNDKTLREGDLVIIEGLLRSNGGIVATHIRIIGMASAYEGPASSFGNRLWGSVRSNDVNRHRLVVMTSEGQRMVSLGANGQVLKDRRRIDFDEIRRGDRVIVYTFDNTRGTVMAYRIVVLRTTDKYPEGTRPSWADPDRDRGRDNGDITQLEGRLQMVRPGLLFNRLVLRTTRGQEQTILAPQSLRAIDQDGRRIPLTELREGQMLTIQYAEVTGTLFAERIDIQ